ncbi:MAG: hypothetical protein WCI73_00005, partial [Phycisphaerae bacterium]
RRGWAILAAGLLMGCVGMSLGGCGWLAMASERVSGKNVPADYKNLDDKSVAIVIYPDWATGLEYAGARDEIGAFTTAQFREFLPKTKLVNYKEVIHWQDDTTQWRNMDMKDIGKHFGVDRILYIEILDYRSRQPGAENLLQGRIHAMARIYETDAPGVAAAWEQEFDVSWPAIAEGPLKSNDLTVRRRVLEAFSEQLVNNFHEHQVYGKNLHDRKE